MKWLQFAFKNALRNRRRSLVTAGLAAVGAAAILLSGGFALYTYQSLREMSARDSGHLTIAHREYFDKEEDTPMQYSMIDYAQIVERLETDSRVRRVLPRVQLNGLISNGEKSLVFIGTGIDPDEFAMRGPFVSLVSGSLLTTASENDNEVILGRDLAKQLHAAPGSSITLMSSTTEGSLSAIDLTVRGVVSYGVPDIDKRAVLMPLGIAQRMLGTRNVSTLSVYLTDTALTDVMASHIQPTLQDKAIKTWLEQAFYYQSVRGIYDRIFGLVGAILCVMVLFAVYNTLSMAVVERTREVGTLRAMGTEPGQIQKLFALEGAAIAGSGAVIGMAIALVVSIILLIGNFQMPPPPGRSSGYPLSVAISPTLYLITGLTITAIATLTAWWVSRRAARKSITEALSHV